MDAPRMLSEALRVGGLWELQRYVTEGRQEDLYLEFKTVRAPMVTADKQNLAIGVSGFANSDGGVIIWGVEASKNKDGVDCSVALRPITGLQKLLSNLKEYSTQLVSPAAQGVEHYLIPYPVSSDSGFAITWVPKGEGMPHMAKAKDQHRYYYRANDSFLILEPYMLADRFGRRPQLKLELAYRWEKSGDKTYLVLGHRNMGRGIALYPALHVEERTAEIFGIFALAERFDIPADPRRFGLPERCRTTLRPSPMWRMFAGGSEHAIHPGTT